MKKSALLIIVGIIVLSSCKRDWSCDCNFGNTSGKIESYSGLTKKEAESKCDNVQLDFQQLDPDVSCEIKKL